MAEWRAQHIMSNSKIKHEVIMYTTKNFRTKKELKAAVDAYNVQAPLYENTGKEDGDCQYVVCLYCGSTHVDILRF